MHTWARYLAIVFAIVLSLHSIVSFTHEHYGQATSLSQFTNNWKDQELKETQVPTSSPKSTPTPTPLNSFDYSESLPLTNLTNTTHRRANATFVILARNSDVDGMVRSVRDMEDRFNRKFGYPYVFLNEEEFSDEFKRRVGNLISSKVEWGVIPREHWFQPDWIDETKAKEGRDRLVKENVIYGGSVSYRNMCRFNSGFFFRHPLVQKYRWYWRIEPDVHFHCDLTYDPFLYMEDNNKTYSFTISMYEFRSTITTLWENTMQFAKEHPEYIARDNALGFISDDEGKTYNLCHFWSNFEIADMNFYRAPAYQAYFDYLEEKGGFYYERWGDAPVHSIAVALFASKDQIHFFDEIGYEHNPFIHCPRDIDVWKKGRCGCNRKKSFDYDGYSCMSKWDKFLASS